MTEIFEVSFRAHHAHLVSKNTTCGAPAIVPNFTIAPGWMQLHQMLPLARKLNVHLNCNLIKYCGCHQKCAFLWDSTSLLRYHSLPLLVSYLYYSLTLLFFDSASLSLYSSLTMVFSYCTVLWLSTVLLLYYAGILPFCYSTSLFSTILWLYCSLLHYSLTLLFFYRSLIWL